MDRMRSSGRLFFHRSFSAFYFSGRCWTAIPSRDPRRRPVAMTLLAMGSTIGLVGLTIFAMASDVRMTKPEIAMQPKRPPAPLQKLDAAGIYATNCLACHGVDGTGNTMRVALATLPDFTSAAWQKTQTDANFTSRIENGKAPMMPPFKGKLTTDQIQALLIYVRAFAAKAPASQ
jgi:mono/diheme cytochrome c family protein